MQLENVLLPLAPQLYDTLSLYALFLVKQLRRKLPAPQTLIGRLERRFHLIESFSLGDVSQGGGYPGGGLWGTSPAAGGLLPGIGVLLSPGGECAGGT